MDFRFPDEVEDFRLEVRAFLREALAEAVDHRDPADLTGLSQAFERDLHRRVGALGWLSLPPVEQAVFNFEAAKVNAPLIDTAMTLAGHLIASYRRDLLPRLEAGDVAMCIAYTEENAGSDLSSIESIARPHDGRWVLSGKKVLITGAHKADLCCTIVCTDPEAPLRRRMTMFLVDMTLPGILVRRRETMNGWSLDEVEFDQVSVSGEAVLGEPGAGWTQLISALAAERSSMFWLGFASSMLDLLADFVKHGTRGQRPLVEDPIARDSVARLSVELAAADRLARRALWDPADPTWTAMAKIAATELLQDLAQTATELAGPAGLLSAAAFEEGPDGAAGGGRFGWEYLERVHATIGAGTNEVQRDAIARFGLGFKRGR